MTSPAPGGALPLDALVKADDLDLPGVLDAMHRLAAGDLAGKVMVTPDSETQPPGDGPRRP